MAGEAGDLGHHVHQHILALTARTHRHIAKALAGQAQALGIGEAGESVGVERRRVGHLFAVECDIPVGLIADEEDIVAERLALFGQDLCHAGERPGRVDHAGGVVGGVDEHTGGLFADHLLECVQIGLEGRCLRRHHLEDCPGARHIGAVLREVGRKGEHLVAGLRDRTDGMGNGTRRTGGGEDVLLLIGQAKGLCQVRCHIGAEARVALTGAVAVQVYRLFVGQQILHGGSELLRAGHAGVAQRVIEHVLISDLGSTLLAVHEGLADDALIAEHRAVGLVQHNTFPREFICGQPYSSAPP